LTSEYSFVNRARPSSHRYVLSTVVNRVRRSERVVNNHRSSYLRRLWCDVKVEQEAGHLLFAVALSCSNRFRPTVAQVKTEIQVCGHAVYAGIETAERSCPWHTYQKSAPKTRTRKLVRLTGTKLQNVLFVTRS